jgi:NAD(P)-dependent dehydrogenase (short-subunit alcohol dehydrogenase family)
MFDTLSRFVRLHLRPLAAEHQESIAMMPLGGNVAVITGGTSVIGECSAEVFIANGAMVVIAGRRQDRGVADFIDRANVGMIQCGSGTRFAAEAFERLRVLG